MPENSAIITGLFNANPTSAQNRAEMKDALEQAMRRTEQGRLVLKVPQEASPLLNRNGMHYHYRPEVFLQMRGRTEFNFPRESFGLGEGELCIIPAGVPHGEVVAAGPHHPFRNLVAGFYNNTLSLHLAHEARPGKPDIEVIEFFDAPNLDVFLTLANTTAQTHAMNSPARDVVIKGLVLALLGLFRNILEAGGGHLNHDIGKVFQAKCLVREQFGNPELSVQHIAAQLGCSSDYLSHRFHTETHERLTHYIQRIRIEGAILALESTKRTISEIAYACGFADPAYFARVFKQRKGITPQEYRQELDAHHRQLEHQPKTVYHDRLDFSPGVPHDKEPSGAN